VQARRNELPDKGSEPARIMRVVRLAERYGGGTMLTFESGDPEGTFDKIDVTAANAQELNEFLLEFSSYALIK
jgi:hypothetical protein